GGPRHGCRSCSARVRRCSWGRSRGWSPAPSVSPGCWPRAACAVTRRSGSASRSMRRCRSAWCSRRPRSSATRSHRPRPSRCRRRRTSPARRHTPDASARLCETRLMPNALTDLLGISAPIVLGPFGGMSSVALTAAVSEAGGLGSYGLYGYPPERIAEIAAQLRAATDRPFAVNLWVPVGDEVGPDEVDLTAALKIVAPLYAELGLALPTSEPPAAHPAADFGAQLQAVLDASPAVASFVYGMPDTAAIRAAHDRGIRVVGTATTVAEAVRIAEAGADAVVAT